eukprot:TRINITY_DN70722_c0_g1_i1.p1 TRINITY_DN70722_c0_g1~~TRINITY_DN70722_c0_g1_i1.p1  ORF type:complete len:696 (+),score=264.09 TRINITY_DN70722_c0_g1_i1:108-2090(+)
MAASDVKLLLVGDAWPAAAALGDNICTKVPRGIPLSHSAPHIATLLGLQTLDDVRMCKARGRLPQVSPGGKLELSQTPEELGARGGMLVVYVRRRPVRLLLCGDSWPCRPKLTDNPYVLCPRAEPLLSCEAAVLKALGAESLQELDFFRGAGKAPDVTPTGRRLNLARTPDQLGPRFKPKAVWLYVARKEPPLRRLRRLFEKYDPGKVATAEVLLEQYAGQEEHLFKELRRRYGPEPPPPAEPRPQHVDPSAGAAAPAPPAPAAADAVKRDRFGFEIEDEELQAEIDAVTGHSGAAEGRRAAAAAAAACDPDAAPAALLPVAQWGLSDADRRALWPRLCGGAAAKARAGDAEQYAAVLAEAQRDGDEVSAEQISRDLPRTYPGNDRFAEGAELWQPLRRVLLAHAQTSPSGYCQGLNFVAGALLLVLPEEDAYWVLREISDGECFMQGYYSAGMYNCTLDQRVLRCVIDEELPGLTGHLQSLGISLADLSVRWFLCLFIDAAPIETVHRLWDLFLLLGLPLLFRVAVALLRRSAPKLMGTDDISSAILAMRDSTRRLCDPGPLLCAALQEKVTLGRLLDCRRREQAAQDEERAEQERKRAELLRRRAEAAERRAQQEQRRRDGAAGASSDEEDGSPASPNPRQRIANFISVRFGLRRGKS